MIKFFQDRAAVKHGFIEKLAAKNATARALRQRLDTQLKQVGTSAAFMPAFYAFFRFLSVRFLQSY